MDKKYKKLRLDQMDRLLERYRALASGARPSKGWIRAIRESIGMSGPQLGRRLAMSPSGLFQLEISEANNSISLKTLSKAAQALDCTVVYAVVPNRSLKMIVRRQAFKQAEAQVSSVAHTMMLENQLPSDETLERQVDRLTSEMAENLPGTLWND